MDVLLGIPLFMLSTIRLDSDIEAVYYLLKEYLPTISITRTTHYNIFFDSMANRG